MIREREPYQDGAAASNGPTNAMSGPVNAVLIPEFGLVKSQLILRGTRHVLVLVLGWAGLGSHVCHARFVLLIYINLYSSKPWLPRVGMMTLIFNPLPHDILWVHLQKQKKTGTWTTTTTTTTTTKTGL